MRQLRFLVNGGEISRKQNICMLVDVAFMALLENQYLLFSPPVRKYNTLPLFEAYSFLRSIKQTRPGRTGGFKLLRDVTTLLIFYLAVKQQYPSANMAL